MFGVGINGLVNGLKYCVFSEVDVERNEIVCEGILV